MSVCYYPVSSHPGNRENIPCTKQRRRHAFVQVQLQESGDELVMESGIILNLVASLIEIKADV